jgi:hypothetical protein
VTATTTGSYSVTGLLPGTYTVTETLSSLCLGTANGSDFNPGNYSAFRTWILYAIAINMAYMLSWPTCCRRSWRRWN